MEVTSMSYLVTRQAHKCTQELTHLQAYGNNQTMPVFLVTP